MKDYPKIILARPKVVFDTFCPKCGKIDIVAKPSINIRCNNCSTSYPDSAKINIYFSVAKKIEQKLGEHNGIYVLGERDDSKVFNAEDALRPRSKHEDDIYHAILAIKEIKKKQKCWDVGDITNEYDADYKVTCNNCGYCLNCVQCQCGKHYVPKSVKKDGNIIHHYSCPSCDSKKYKQSIIPEFQKKDGKLVCPYCSDNHIAHAKFPAEKKKCPKCKSTNITKPRDIPVYRLLIERQKRHME